MPGILLDLGSEAAAGLKEQGIQLIVYLKGLILLKLNISTGNLEHNWEATPIFYLNQNYPNPFNPTTKISYTISEKCNVSLKVFNLLGSEVKELVKGEMEAGSYNVEFNASDLPNGVYFYQLKAGSFIDSKEIILLK